MADVATLLATHASLPGPRQPAWGLRASADAAERTCDDRLAAFLPLLQALPCSGTLRILELECAQGYFTLGIAHALAARGRAVEVVGVDRSEDNIRFCEALAAHHGIAARFVHATVGMGFLQGQEATGWDAVLAIDPSLAVNEAAALDVAMSSLRAHARIAVCGFVDFKPPSGPVAMRPVSGERLSSGWAFRRRLVSLAGADGSVQTLQVCSDSMAWVGERWFAFDRVVDRSHAGIPDAFAGQRWFLLGADAMIKQFRGDGRHGDFNRSELAAEAEVLHALQGEPGRYPALLARADDGDVVWLARGVLPGELLSARIAAGDIDRDAVARELLGELAHLESLGFHHGDLRCWNCLVDGAAVRLIDFGAMTRTVSPLHRLALAAMLLELANGESGHEQPFYASVHPVGAYPSAWQPLVRYLLGVPQSAFSHAEALRILTTSLDGVRSGSSVVSVDMEPDGEIVSSAAREHCEAFRCLREHGEAMERALDGEERARAAQLAEVSELRGRVRELERARQDSELEHVRYTDALHAELEKSRTYTASLEARVEREAADARSECEALEAARCAAADYSESLRQSLDTSQAYTSSLKDALEQSQAYASSLEARIEREAADANRERAALAADLAGWQARHARLQRRFRMLKFLWPRETDDPKEPE